MADGKMGTQASHHSQHNRRGCMHVQRAWRHRAPQGLTPLHACAISWYGRARSRCSSCMLAAGRRYPHDLTTPLPPHSPQIVSGARDKTIKLWNTLGECKYTIAEPEGHTEWVSCVRFSPMTTNPIIVSGGWDKLVGSGACRPSVGACLQGQAVHSPHTACRTQPAQGFCGSGSSSGTAPKARRGTAAQSWRLGWSGRATQADVVEGRRPDAWAAPLRSAPLSKEAAGLCKQLLARVRGHSAAAAGGERRGGDREAGGALPLPAAPRRPCAAPAYQLSFSCPARLHACMRMYRCITRALGAP